MTFPPEMFGVAGSVQHVEEVSVKPPGQLPAGKAYSYRISTLDVLPTCLDATGITADRSARLDGQSFLQAVKTGVPSRTERRPPFWLFRDRWAVLSGEWKLVRSPDPGGQRAYQALYDGDSADAKPAPFNLTKDPAEQYDIAKDNPAVVQRLSRLFLAWRREMRREATSEV